MFLGPGRAAFLEFLRNLTPQILFLAATLVAGAPLDYSRLQFDWPGIKNLLAVLACGAVFLGAMAANMTKFLDDTLHSTENLDIEVRRLRAKHERLFDRLRAIVKAAWRLNRVVFIQAVLAMVVVQASTFAVAITAFQTAAGVLRGV